MLADVVSSMGGGGGIFFYINLVEGKVSCNLSVFRCMVTLFWGKH